MTNPNDGARPQVPFNTNEGDTQPTQAMPTTGAGFGGEQPTQAMPVFNTNATGAPAGEQPTQAMPAVPPIPNVEVPTQAIPSPVSATEQTVPMGAVPGAAASPANPPVNPYTQLAYGQQAPNDPFGNPVNPVNPADPVSPTNPASPYGNPQGQGPQGAQVPQGQGQGPQDPVNPYAQPAYGQQPGQPYGLPPQGPQGYNGYPPENQSWNACAIVGFIFSFFIALVGLIVSIVGLSQIKKRGGKGKGLAIAGIVISIINMLLVVALLGFGEHEVDTAISSNTTSSQQADGSTSEQQGLDELDESLKDEADSTDSDLSNDENSDSSTDSNTDTDSNSDDSLLPTVAEFVNSDAVQQEVATQAQQFADQGIQVVARAEGDTLIYDYTVPDEYVAASDSIASSLSSNDSTFQSIADMLGTTCKTTGPAQVRVYMHTASGQSVVDKTYTEQQ